MGNANDTNSQPKASKFSWLKDHAANIGTGAFLAAGALLVAQGLALSALTSLAALGVGITMKSAVLGGVLSAALIGTGGANLRGAQWLQQGRKFKPFSFAAGVFAGALFLTGINQAVSNSIRQINFPQPGAPAPVSELAPLSPQFAKAGISAPAGFTFAPTPPARTLG